MRLFGVAIKPGDRVRLWPQKSADIMDMALKGKVAIIEAIESDLDDRVTWPLYLRMIPGAISECCDSPVTAFFFSPEEVEPIALNGEVPHEG